MNISEFTCMSSANILEEMGSVKYCETVEEIKKQLKTGSHTQEVVSGIDESILCDSSNPDVIIAL